MISVTNDHCRLRRLTYIYFNVLCVSKLPFILTVITQALYVFMGLAFARDEILWLVRHAEHPHPKMKSKANVEDFLDPLLPEMLFHMEELRGKISLRIETSYPHPIMSPKSCYPSET